MVGESKGQVGEVVKIPTLDLDIDPVILELVQGQFSANTHLLVDEIGDPSSTEEYEFGHPCRVLIDIVSTFLVYCLGGVEQEVPESKDRIHVEARATDRVPFCSAEPCRT